MESRRRQRRSSNNYMPQPQRPSIPSVLPVVVRWLFLSVIGCRFTDVYVCSAFVPVLGSARTYVALSDDGIVTSTVGVSTSVPYWQRRVGVVVGHDQQSDNRFSSDHTIVQQYQLSRLSLLVLATSSSTTSDVLQDETFEIVEIHRPNDDQQNINALPSFSSSSSSSTVTTVAVAVATTTKYPLATVTNEKSLVGHVQSTACLDETEQQSEVRDVRLLLSLLWCIAAISAIDRVAMSIALVPMSVQYDLNDTTIGLISSLFSIGYGLAIIPAGLVISFVSPKRLIVIGMTIWSLATILTPMSAQLFLPMCHIVPILGVRSMVGMGEAFLIPTIHRLLSVWITMQQKSLALAFIFSGFHAGTIGAYLLSPIIMDTFYATIHNNISIVDDSSSWTALFYVYGAFGILLQIPWLLFAQDQPTTVALATASTTSSEDVSLTFVGSTSEGIASSTTTMATTTSWDEAVQSYRDAPWNDFIQSKGVWGMLLAHCAKNWGLYTSLSWTPTFYAEQYHIGIRDSAWLSVMPSVAGAIGAFIAGTLADAAIQNMSVINPSVETTTTTTSTTQIRKQFQSIGLLGPALALAALAYHIPEDAWVAQLYLMVAVGLQSFNAGGFEAGTQDKSGPKWIGMLYSVTSLPSVMVGTFGVYATGIVLDLSHQDWSIVWYMNAGVNVLGALAFIFLYDSKREFE